ncbi:hypothetical protein PG994_002371 [Apiospora phragmitis]|uniref:Uncharacterized protein n=1 Tax=Apiospora phragmitis TaxID=2905665 RepID=A0ABR1WW53_9PEZI
MFADPSPSVKDTVKDISIEVGERPGLKLDDVMLIGCRPWGPPPPQHCEYEVMCYRKSTDFIHRLLATLTQERYPHLARIHLKGFRILRNDPRGPEHSSPHTSTTLSNTTTIPDPELTQQCIRDCPWVDEGFMETSNVDRRTTFLGYDYDLPLKEGSNLWEHSTRCRRF